VDACWPMHGISYPDRRQMRSWRRRWRRRHAVGQTLQSEFFLQVAEVLLETFSQTRIGGRFATYARLFAGLCAVGGGWTWMAVFRLKLQTEEALCVIFRQNYRAGASTT